MKFIKSKLLTALLCAGILALAAPPTPAQTTSTTIKPALAAQVECFHVVTNLAVALLVTNTFTPGKHLGVGVVLCGGASTNTGTVGLSFQVIYAGTNQLKTTTKPFTATFTANGTTAVRDWYVIPDYTLGPCPGLVLGTITNAFVNSNPNAAGSVVVSNAWLEYR